MKLIITSLLFFGVHTEILFAKIVDSTKATEPTVFTVGFGMGLGYASQVCELCKDEEMTAGYTFHAVIGFQFNKKFIADAMATTWIGFNNSNFEHTSRLTLLGRLTWFPSIEKGYRFTLGVGAGNYFLTPNKPVSSSDGNQSLGSVIGVGWAISSEIGYEFNRGKKYTLTPFLNIIACWPGQLRANEMWTIENSTVSLIPQFGLSFRLNTPFPQ